MLTFNRILPDQEFGTVTIEPSAWQGQPLGNARSPADSLSPALLVAILMRGYLTLAADRPPGNVHAGQRLTWGLPAQPGMPLTVGLRCIGKELKKERRWLRFEVRLWSDAGIHLTAVNTSIWGG